MDRNRVPFQREDSVVESPLIKLDDDEKGRQRESSDTDNYPDKSLAGPSFYDGDYLTDECFQRLMQDWMDPTVSRSPSEERPERHVIPEAFMDGVLYRPGQSVQLYDETYLRIETILAEQSTGSILLGGRRLVPTLYHADTYVPRWRHELVWMVDDKEDIPLDIVRQSVTIKFTNNPERHQGYPSRSSLFCRLKESKKSGSAAVEYISSDEADEIHRYDPALLRQKWRGVSTPFGDATDAAGEQIDLTDSQPRRSGIHRYTFGDGFCGAGGVSSGAQDAGLHIKWAFDSSHNATTTYRFNFRTAICEDSDVFSFLTNDSEFLRVDISHGSPPCQTFSPAHTINCANDDANSSCIFACEDLIKKAKPRIQTMEETCGLFERHKGIFFRVIQDFVEIGYSVRWGVLNCMDYGVPQSRRRLIIIASGPGEALPEFPKPTHGLPGSGLREYETINSIITRIPTDAADHDVRGALERGLRNGTRIPFDPSQLARTVTCGGGEHNYHPSGQRGYTNREFACLQTFPIDYQFGPETRKQIGNAVPPILARSIYREILKTLRQTDERESRSNGTSNAIVLD